MDDGMAVGEVLEAIAASALAMAAEVRRAADPGSAGAGFEPDPVDPLGEQATACLDGLTGVAGMEARVAAVKVQLAAGYVTADAAMAIPTTSPQDAAIRQMAVRAEVAGALTVSEGAAERLLVESAMLTTERPLTLAALQAGRISWQHARIMCDETDELSPEAAAAFEAHFLDPDAPGAARGCFAGDLAPARFRAKARYWRERHHQDSIEKRHAKSVKDRRLEYRPDRDGMAWFSAYLPADQAAGIWNRTTATARGLRGPTEKRTLSQLRADVFSTRLLTPNHRAHAIGTTDGTDGTDGTGGAPAGGVQPGDVLADDVPTPQAQVLVTVPVFSLLGHTDEPATLDGYGPIRRPWPAGSSPTAPRPSSGSWSTRGTVRHWRSAAPATGSPNPCANGYASATPNAPSPTATTTPSTTTPTTFSPGPTAAAPASPTSANPAPNTTD